MKTVANDLSAIYDDDGIQVLVSTYETLGDEQKSYTSFLSDEADVALFVIKDEFNQFTAAELTSAIESKEKSGHPRVYVLRYYSNNSPEDPQISEKLDNILHGQHAVGYRDQDELRIQAQKRILSAVKKKLVNNQKKAFTRKSVWRWAVAMVLLISGWVFWPVFNNKQKVLTIGGGSVLNYIKENNNKVNLDSLHNGIINIHLPSGAAYSVLGEEGNRTDHRFVPVILSADYVMADSVFTSVCQDLYERLRICEYWLGRDSLVVYTTPGWVESQHLDFGIDLSGKRYLTSDHLARLLEVGLREKDVSVFVTSASSGTRNAYKRVLGSREKLLEDKSLEAFHQNNPTNPNITKRVYLGCKYFYPKEEATWRQQRIGDSPFEAYYIKKTEGNIPVEYEGDYVYKDLFLYFPAYYPNSDEPRLLKRLFPQEAGTLTIPPCVLKLLKKTGFDDLNRWDKMPNAQPVKYEAKKGDLFFRDKLYEQWAPKEPPKKKK